MDVMGRENMCHNLQGYWIGRSALSGDWIVKELRFVALLLDAGLPLKRRQSCAALRGCHL